MTVSMRVMSAGDGYKYLLLLVAAAESDRSLSTPLTLYYAEEGTPTGACHRCRRPRPHKLNLHSTAFRSRITYKARLAFPWPCHLNHPTISRGDRPCGCLRNPTRVAMARPPPYARQSSLSLLFNLLSAFRLAV